VEDFLVAPFSTSNGAAELFKEMRMFNANIILRGHMASIAAQVRQPLRPMAQLPSDETAEPEPYPSTSSSDVDDKFLVVEERSFLHRTRKGFRRRTIRKF
jgi:hypothetical protein